MSKNKKKRSKKKDYDVGYGKPPEEFKWKKGCPSPNPQGRPKKIRTLKEALQVSMNKEINTQNERGEIKKITCLEALASKTIADAISKDGPTRRLLYREDLLNLVSKEQEFEYPPETAKLIEVEKEYADIIRSWAEVDPKIRNVMAQFIRETLLDITNAKTTEGEINEE